jgi:hypothetical protein
MKPPTTHHVYPGSPPSPTRIPTGPAREREGATEHQARCAPRDRDDAGLHERRKADRAQTAQTRRTVTATAPRRVGMARRGRDPWLVACDATRLPRKGLQGPRSAASGPGLRAARASRLGAALVDPRGENRMLAVSARARAGRQGAQIDGPVVPPELAGVGRAQLREPACRGSSPDPSRSCSCPVAAWRRATGGSMGLTSGQEGISPGAALRRRRRSNVTPIISAVRHDRRLTGNAFPTFGRADRRARSGWRGAARDRRRRDDPRRQDAAGVGHADRAPGGDLRREHLF